MLVGEQGRALLSERERDGEVNRTPLGAVGTRGRLKSEPTGLRPLGASQRASHYAEVSGESAR